MKYKLTLFLFSIFLLIISLSLVHAFESEVYQIGIEIPSTDDADEEEAPIYDDNGDDGGDSPGGGRSSPKDTPAFTPTTETGSQEDAEETGDIILEEEPSEGFFSTITGAVVGAATSPTGIIIIVFVVALAGVFAVTRRALKKRDTEKPI